MSTTPSGPPPKPTAPPSAHPPSHPAPPHPPRRGRATRTGLPGVIGYLLLGRRRPGEITIISHSNLFYWWPVWVVGFTMALITYYQGVHAGFISGKPAMVKFPGKHSYEFVDKINEDEKRKYPTENFEGIITDNTQNPYPMTQHGGEAKHTWPLMSNSKNLGVIFSITLLLVITITNVPLRGLWSLIIIIIIVLGSIIFALAGWWDEILSRSRLLAVHINLGAYLLISLTLFVLWLVNFAFFDRQRYLAVTPGQVRLHLAIGEGEIVYDTVGMVFQKQRSDLFRHWILGFGSGDLIVRPAGGKDPIDLPNVLFVGSKVREIQELIKEKEVVAG
jgi:hypothetical protein